jgi:hypothetical protein
LLVEKKGIAPVETSIAVRRHDLILSHGAQLWDCFTSSEFQEWRSGGRLNDKQDCPGQPGCNYINSAAPF